MNSLKKLFTEKDVWSLKYYLAFCGIVLSVYIYSMVTGWRFMNFGEGSRKHERTTNSRIYHHK